MNEKPDSAPQSQSKKQKMAPGSIPWTSFWTMLKFDQQINWKQIQIEAVKWSLIILGYLALLLAFAPLVKAVIEAFINDAYMKWGTLAISVVALLLSVFLLVKKKSGWIVLRVPLAAFALLVVYAALRYPTTDLRGFSLLYRPVEALLNPIFLGVILTVVMTLWVRRYLPLGIRITLTLLLIYCASIFLYGIIVGVGLEESFLGTDFFGRIPWFFAQPAYLTIEFVFPMVLIIAMILWVTQRKTYPAAAKVFLGLAILILLAEAIGFTAMFRNRVPNLFSLVIAPKPGVGEAQTTFTDPSGHQVTTRIATRNFDQEKNNELADYYTMALSYTPPAHSDKTEDKEASESYQLNLSVKDGAGKDVLFLSDKDFEIFQNDILQKKYAVNFEISGVKTGQNVILLLDHSGSMSSVIDQLKLAAKAFIDLKSYRDKILLIPFGNSPEPQPVSTDKQVLKDQIDKMPNGGGTHLLTSILEGYRLSENFSGPTTMVVMTDGKASDRNEQNSNALMDRLKSRKIRVYSVGLGKAQSLDETFLENLAKEGGGRYYRTEDAAELKGIYQTIGAELQSKYTVTYQPQMPPPQVSITTPGKAETVFSQIPFTARIPNVQQAAVKKVAFYVDNNRVAEQNTTDQSQYSVPLDPAQMERGKHNLKVVAQAENGNKAEDAIEIDVQPAAELTIITPENLDHIGETTDIEAELIIRSDQPPAPVHFFVDGQPIGTADDRPYTTLWDARTFSAGEHDLMAQATLADGTQVQDAIKIMVVKEMSIRFAHPLNGQELEGHVPLKVDIINENPEDPVAEVRYSLNSEELGRSNAPTFEYQLDAADFLPGSYAIKAEARTRSGKIANATVRATVSTGHLVVGQQGHGQEMDQKTNQGQGATAAKFFFPPRNVEIIMDASNSMWGQLAEGSKIDIAKQVLARIVAMIPQGTQVALRVYGSHSQVKQGDCKDTQLLVPLSPLNPENLLKQIRSITPRGKTPIAYSLTQAPLDLAEAKGTCVVLLITDGLESCDGDPVTAAAMLQKIGVKTKLHVIGYDVGNDAHRAMLASIAQAGGGSFFSAGSGAELTDAIVEAATVNFQVMDSRGKMVLKSSVGSKIHELKVGTYQLVVDLDPPLRLASFLITKDRTTQVILMQQDDHFEFKLKE